MLSWHPFTPNSTPPALPCPLLCLSPQVRVERGEKLVWLGGTERVVGGEKEQVRGLGRGGGFRGSMVWRHV